MKLLLISDGNRNKMISIHGCLQMKVVSNDYFDQFSVICKFRNFDGMCVMLDLTWSRKIVVEIVHCPVQHHPILCTKLAILLFSLKHTSTTSFWFYLWAFMPCNDWLLFCRSFTAKSLNYYYRSLQAYRLFSSSNLSEN